MNDRDSTKILRGRKNSLILREREFFDRLLFDVRQRLVGNQASIASLSYPLSDDVAQHLFGVHERSDLGWI
jgi:hypothetical protein